MADEPEQRQSAPPKKPVDPEEAARPTLSPMQSDESAKVRLKATVGKSYPVADEEELERSRKKGGEHPDVPPAEVQPPPTD